MKRRTITRRRGWRNIRPDVTSVIAHQLKTPLVGIKSSIEVILSGQLGSVPSAQKEYLQIALDEVERLVALGRDLLDAARIDQKEFELVRRPTNLVSLTQETIDNLKMFARATNTTILFSVSGKIPIINIDAAKVQQVVSNIIDNAIRYKKRKGQVTVSLQRVGRAVIFSCHDQGLGISTAEAKKIFTKFYRGRGAIELIPTGSGLGLYIARAIIEQSGGKIWFTSKPNWGTTFYFSLPVQLKNKKR